VPEELHEIERQLRALNDMVIRHISEFGEWRKNVELFMGDARERNTRAPMLLFAGISAAIGVASILVQIWISSKP